MTGLYILIFSVMRMFNLFVSSRHQAFSILILSTIVKPVTYCV